MGFKEFDLEDQRMKSELSYAAVRSTTYRKYDPSELMEKSKSLHAEFEQ